MSRPSAPLFVYGPGGVGKSSLLARFVLDQSGDPAVQVAYIDIDRPTIRPDRPATLLIDIISQLRSQLDTVSGPLDGLAKEIAYSMNREEAADARSPPPLTTCG